MASRLWNANCSLPTPFSDREGHPRSALALEDQALLGALLVPCEPSCGYCEEVQVTEEGPWAKAVVASGRQHHDLQAGQECKCGVRERRFSWEVATLLPEEVRKCLEALAQSQTLREASADFCLLLAGPENGAERGRAGESESHGDGRGPGWDGRLIPVAAVPLAGRPEGTESSVLFRCPLSLSLSLREGISRRRAASISSPRSYSQEKGRGKERGRENKRRVVLFVGGLDAPLQDASKAGPVKAEPSKTRPKTSQAVAALHMERRGPRLAMQLGPGGFASWRELQGWLALGAAGQRRCGGRSGHGKDETNR